MNTKQSSVGINIIKKQSNLGLLQDIYTLIYCLIIIPISLYNIYYNTNLLNWKIDLFSYIYFVITGIINIYYIEYTFIIHHIICITLIWLGNYNNNNIYYLWLSKCYLAEISNIFLSGKNIIRFMRINNMLTNRIYENICDLLFVLMYFVIRMCYLFPYTIIHLYDNYYSKLTYNYFNHILVNIIIMSILNIYWSYLIIQKIIKFFNKKNN